MSGPCCPRRARSPARGKARVPSLGGREETLKSGEESPCWAIINADVPSYAGSEGGPSSSCHTTTYEETRPSMTASSSRAEDAIYKDRVVLPEGEEEKAQLGGECGIVGIAADTQHDLESWRVVHVEGEDLVLLT